MPILNRQTKVAHKDHPWERCNTDDIVDRGKMTTAWAKRTVAAGECRYCRWCYPEPPGS